MAPSVPDTPVSSWLSFADFWTLSVRSSASVSRTNSVKKSNVPDSSPGVKNETFWSGKSPPSSL
jgi:hypothetical protein